MIDATKFQIYYMLCQKKKNKLVSYMIKVV